MILMIFSDCSDRSLSSVLGEAYRFSWVSRNQSASFPRVSVVINIRLRLDLNRYPHGTGC